jgi:multidrug efflux pump subunit AcrB
VALGIYGLSKINKNEFPTYTIREGLVSVVYPGADAHEVEQEVTKPLEDKIFQYKEVDKVKTTSQSVNGMAMVNITISEDVDNPKMFWNKLRHDLESFHQELPQGVTALQVDDDFGDVSTILLTLQSDTKTYRELKGYMDQLCDTLRKVESVGRLAVQGLQHEQICVTLDNERLTQYDINDQTVAQKLTDKGYITSGGRLKNDDTESPLYVQRSGNNIYSLGNIIVYAEGDKIIRLKDIATIERKYPEKNEYITNNGHNCLLLSIEMKNNRDVSAMGAAVNAKLRSIEHILPQDVKIFKISDKSQIVDDSIDNFLHEMMIAIVAVILMVVLLMPFRVALVATFTIPITIFTSLGIFWAMGMELNTVTLAAMIVTLGMIVDDAIVIIDGYMDLIGQGMSRWHASIASTQHFFKSIFSATLTISITFFPFLIFLDGATAEFINSFPYAIFIILFISMFVAQLFIPIVQYAFIRKPMEMPKKDGKKHFSMLQLMQDAFDRLIDLCFAHKRTTVAVGGASVILGLYLMTIIPQEQMPLAERNQFAVEITSPQGTSLKHTALIADSIEQSMRKDKRIVSITSFNGTSSPRFNDQYSPQAGGSNYVQFIVNTISAEATNELVKKFKKDYSESIPGAFVRIKQLSYSEESNPIEVRLSGSNIDSVSVAVDKVCQLMRGIKDLQLVRSDVQETLASSKIVLDEEKSGQMGVTNKDVEQVLMMRYGDGLPVSKIWQDGNGMDVVLKSSKSDSASISDVLNERIPVYFGLSSVSLRQVAYVEPSWQYSNIPHRNGLLTATVKSEVQSGVNVLDATTEIQKKTDFHNIATGRKCELWRKI